MWEVSHTDCVLLSQFVVDSNFTTRKQNGLLAIGETQAKTVDITTWENGNFAKKNP